jgi:hypothetical protein
MPLKGGIRLPSRRDLRQLGSWPELAIGSPWIKTHEPVHSFVSDMPTRWGLLAGWPKKVARAALSQSGKYARPLRGRPNSSRWMNARQGPGSPCESASLCQSPEASNRLKDWRRKMPSKHDFGRATLACERRRRVADQNYANLGLERGFSTATRPAMPPSDQQHSPAVPAHSSPQPPR